MGFIHGLPSVLGSLVLGTNSSPAHELRWKREGALWYPSEIGDVCASRIWSLGTQLIAHTENHELIRSFSPSDLCLVAVRD